MDNREKKSKSKKILSNEQRQRDTELVIFLAEQEDIRDERGEFEANGTIFKTMVEIRPADDTWPEDTWDAYVIVDGHFYLVGSYDDPEEGSRAASAARIRLEKSAKNHVANFLLQRNTEW